MKKVFVRNIEMKGDSAWSNELPKVTSRDLYDSIQYFE